MVFNTGIALVLMEMSVFQALSHVLGLYANVAIAWMMAVVADLVVNKPMGWSPKGIEFKRAHLYDINPVGVGAMGIASALSVAAHLGAFGPLAQAFSALIALVTAFVTAPLIAWATQGRYYIARRSIPIVSVSVPVPAEQATADGSYQRLTARCTVCERDYETEDMAHCPAYSAPICSLCCTLDARCDDQCKPDARLSAQWAALLRRLLPARMAPQLDAGLAHYLLLLGLVTPVLAGLLLLGHRQMQRALGEQAVLFEPTLGQGFVSAFLLLWIVAGIVCWWLVLAHRSRHAAQEESRRQTAALQREIASHARTDEALQQAKRQADSANQAKSRYITTISHELRTPLNSILGYAQLLEEDEAMPAHRRQAVSVIRRGGDHLLSLIEGTLDIARIESGKLALDVRPMRFADGLAEIARLFELQAAGRGLQFSFAVDGTLPVAVRADEKRLRQILINLLGNALKFTPSGQVRLHVRYQREMARFEISDTGPGMTAAELARVFEPFERGSAASGMSVGSTGLGLTIARMLTELMGGEMTVASQPGAGHHVHDPPVPARTAARRPRVAAAARRPAPAPHRLRGPAPPRAGGRQRRGRPPPAAGPAAAAGLRARHRGLGRGGAGAAGAAGRGLRRRLHGPRDARHRRLGDHPSPARGRPRDAAGGGVGQRLRQAAGERRRPAARGLPGQAGAHDRTARLAGPPPGPAVDAGARPPRPPRLRLRRRTPRRPAAGRAAARAARRRQPGPRARHRPPDRRHRGCRSGARRLRRRACGCWRASSSSRP